MDALNEPSGLSDTSLKKSLGIYGRESLEERSEELGLQNTSTLSKEALQEEIERSRSFIRKEILLSR